jgi:nucleoside-diphosphate-sugar epimerase
MLFKNVVITGISGFVGQNLKVYLHKAYRVIGVSRDVKSKNIISYNDLSKSILSNSKAVIHLAGKAHDLESSSDEETYIKANTELTKSLFNSFLHSNCEIFIYMSSVKSVADKVEGVLHESVSPNPKTFYGKSKLAAENYILSIKLPNSKRVYILRPCMIHGPSNKGNLNLLYKLVSKRIPWVLGLYENKRSYCSVENLTFIISELIKNKKIPTGIYNIADDQPLSTNDIISLISVSHNKKPLIWNVSKILVRVAAKIGDQIPFPLNSERLKKLTDSYVVSNEKIKKAIGKPLPVNSKDGILTTFKSFQLNN